MNDDNEPLTRKWCVEQGLMAGSMYNGPAWIPEVYGVRQYVRLPMDATRGDMRMLIKALKIEVKARGQ